MTRRLFEIDPYRTTFESAVIRRFPEGGRVGLVLEETCFYPTSGGQHADAGDIGGVCVEDVRAEGEDIVHLLAADPGGDRLAGRIDWPRRFDHMQQHSGQHILSQAFVRVLGLNTVSAHLGTETSTIELAAEKIARPDLDRVEDEANRAIFLDLPILLHSMTPEEAATRGLRRQTARKGILRIVEVEGYDVTACGGTHCRRTGEVGIIKVGKTERIRGETRVEFLCGGRALADYRKHWTWVEEAAVELGRRPSDLPADVRRLKEDAALKGRGWARAEKDLMAYRAGEMLERTPAEGGVRTVRGVFADVTAEGLTALAGALAAGPGVVALLGLDADPAQVVASRSGDVDLDLGPLVRQVLAAHSGKGGGRADFARGAVPRDRVGEALEDLGAAVGQALGRRT